MGMFDWVAYEMQCPNCHRKVDGFQSKSAECELAMVNPLHVDNFYAACRGCGVWIEFDRVRVRDATYSRSIQSVEDKKVRIR